MVSAGLSFVLSFTAVVSCAIYFAPLFLRIARGDESSNDPRLVTSPEPSQGTTERGNANSSTSQQTPSAQQQLTLAMGSTGSSDLNCLIQSRLREFSQDTANQPITAECSRSQELDSSVQLSVAG